MGIGTRQSQEKQDDIWIANVELARSPGHPFYQRLNELLDEEKFDSSVEVLAVIRERRKMTSRRPLLPVRFGRPAESIGQWRVGIDPDCLTAANHAARWSK